MTTLGAVLRRVGPAFIVAVLLPSASQAGPVFGPSLSQYLVIGTGNASTGNLFTSVDLANVEIGADQEVVSTSTIGTQQRVGSYDGGLSLDGTFVETNGGTQETTNNRWDDSDPLDGPNDTVGVPDTLDGARSLFEGIDYSGNVALLGGRADIHVEKTDVNANLGIQCNGTAQAGGCYDPSGTNTFFNGSTEPNGVTLDYGSGISNFDPDPLIQEIGDAYVAMIDLERDVLITADCFGMLQCLALPSIENRSYKDGGSPYVFNLDTLDYNGDGYVVFDIDTNGQQWLINNSDVILATNLQKFAIFRMTEGGYFNFSNSSIMMGGAGGTITDLGALFLVDQKVSNNNVFSLNNVILGGIALWDMNDWNRTTQGVYDPYFSDWSTINLQDVQGCGQFVGHQVLMSDNRWNRCEFATVPEPATMTLFALALAGGAIARRRRAASRQ